MKLFYAFINAMYIQGGPKK